MTWRWSLFRTRAPDLAGMLLLGTVVASCEFFVESYDRVVTLSNDQGVQVSCISKRASFWYEPKVTDEPIHQCITACEAHGFHRLSRYEPATASYKMGDPYQDPVTLPEPCR